MRYFLIVLIGLLTTPLLRGQGKHLEIMAPARQQDYLKGKPDLVVENHYEVIAGERRCKSMTRRIYDPQGNRLLVEVYDSADEKLSSQKYVYSEDKTWTSLLEKDEEGMLSSYRIVLEPRGKQVLKVEQDSGRTEVITFSDQGYEIDSKTRLAIGAILKHTKTKRGSNQREESITVQKPLEKASSRSIMMWDADGRQTSLSMNKQNGNRVKTVFTYPGIDEKENWLKREAERTLYQVNGEVVSLPRTVVERQITYHP